MTNIATSQATDVASEAERTAITNFACASCSRYHLVLVEATDIGERVLCGGCAARDFGVATLPLPTFPAPKFAKPVATLLLLGDEYDALQALAPALLPALPRNRSGLVRLAAAAPSSGDPDRPQLLHVPARQPVVGQQT